MASTTSYNEILICIEQTGQEPHFKGVMRGDICKATRVHLFSIDQNLSNKQMHIENCSLMFCLRNSLDFCQL